MLSTANHHQSALTWVPSSCVYNPPSGAITDAPSPGTVLPRESCTYTISLIVTLTIPRNRRMIQKSCKRRARGNRSTPLWSPFSMLQSLHSRSCSHSRLWRSYKGTAGGSESFSFTFPNSLTEDWSTMSQYAHYSVGTPDVNAAVSKLPPAPRFEDINGAREGFAQAFSNVEKLLEFLLPSRKKIPLNPKKYWSD